MANFDYYGHDAKCSLVWDVPIKPHVGRFVFNLVSCLAACDADEVWWSLVKFEGRSVLSGNQKSADFDRT